MHGKTYKYSSETKAITPLTIMSTNMAMTIGIVTTQAGMADSATIVGDGIPETMVVVISLFAVIKTKIN